MEHLRTIAMNLRNLCSYGDTTPCSVCQAKSSCERKALALVDAAINAVAQRQSNDAQCDSRVIGILHDEFESGECARLAAYLRTVERDIGRHTPFLAAARASKCIGVFLALVTPIH